MRGRLVLAVFSVAILTACGHKQARVNSPPPPSVEPQPAPPEKQTDTIAPKKADVPKATKSEKIDTPLSIPADTVPLLTETGMSSWYGAPYHNRRSSNGEIYNMHAMTAAHRTLPLGSIVRVTNVKTGSTALVRITDRGPFVDGRILDVSYAAAKQLDIYQPGTAKVKVEVMQTPTSLTNGGRWAVQIGSFDTQKQAAEFANHLSRRYHTAKVAKFASPVGAWWIRIRVLNDDRQRAEALAHETETAAGSVYLVRLD